MVLTASRVPDFLSTNPLSFILQMCNLGQTLNFPVPQFPHLLKGRNNLGYRVTVKDKLGEAGKVLGAQ